MKQPKIAVERSQDHGLLGDTAKFFWAHKTTGYRVFLDDDVLPAEGGITALKNKVAEYGNKAAVSVGGSTFTFNPMPTYYRARSMVRFNEGPDRFVNQIGSGFSCHHSDALQFNMADCHAPNMADIWLSVECKRQGVPVVITERKLIDEVMSQEDGPTIYGAYSKDDVAHALTINKEMPWPDPGGYALVSNAKLKEPYILRAPSGKDHILRTIQGNNNFYEPSLLFRIREMNIGGVYIDVGANIGNHSVFFSRECKASAVIACEPYQPLYECLTDNLRRNANKQVWSALSVALYKPTTERKNWIGLEPCDEENLGMTRTTEAKTNPAICTTLDYVAASQTFSHPIGLVKIDVEGAEPSVLLGGLETIKKHRPVLVIECGRSIERLYHVRSILEPLGYQDPEGPYCKTPVYIWKPQ